MTNRSIPLNIHLHMLHPHLVLKDGHHKLTYTVRQAVITPETLFWLSSISDQGIRIIGPGELRGAVGMYYEKMSGTIIRLLPKNMAAQSKTKGK